MATSAIVVAIFSSLLGAAPCPEQERVDEALARSTPLELRERHRWSISLTADGMKLTLLDARGVVVRERVVPAPASCAERETVAAAVLAAWMVATPATLAPPPAPAPKPAPPPRAEPKAEPQTPPIVTREPEAPVPAEPEVPEEPLKPAPAPEPEVRAVEPPLPETPPGSIRLELALDGRAQLAGSLAPGVGLTVSAGDRFGGFLELSTAHSRALALPPGQVRWFRVALGLGARYRFDLTELYVEPAVSIEGAWLRAEGQGFQQNSVATGLDFSACGQLRAGRFFTDAFGIYVGARGCAWPLANRVGVTAVMGTAPLPQFELAALFGVSAGFAVKGSSGSRPSEK